MLLEVRWVDVVEVIEVHDWVLKEEMEADFDKDTVFCVRVIRVDDFWVDREVEEDLDEDTILIVEVEESGELDNALLLEE